MQRKLKNVLRRDATAELCCMQLGEVKWDYVRMCSGVMMQQKQVKNFKE